jgi:SAM-dependent methyltransferase
MTNLPHADETARTFFDELWQRGDPWDLEVSPFERARLACALGMLEGRRSASALELGCGAGAFTRLLARCADHILAVDVSATAIERARGGAGGDARIEFRTANIMDVDLRKEGPWDLIVFSETIYFLGWLYPFCHVAWLAAELFAATRAGGRLLLVNTESGTEDGLIRPWMIRTYRDLFLNVGFALEREEVFRGTKNGVQIGVLMSLFTRTGDAA